MRVGRGSLEGPAAVLREMRRARRRRFVEQLDLMEVLYRVYVGVIFGAIALGLLAGAINEAAATPSAVDSLRDHGPAVLGLVVALGVLAGLRSGARGGPLAIEAAEVQYVLLAPLNRGRALRPAALRQLRIGAIAGAALGAIVGNFVFRRLPGSPVEWIGCLALFGALVPVLVLGGALAASGHRLRPFAAATAGLLLVAWSVADLALGWNSSPATMLGELATLPLQSGTPAASSLLGVVIALALVCWGVVGVGGILLEAARRRAALTAELRFSASVQDLRTVVLLRRQLASERPRRRPWLRLAVAGRNRFPVWRRGWQSFLRWPLARLLRATVLGAGAGAVMAGAWSGATPAFVLPGVLLFVAALDLVEPLAQEADHPTRRQLLPVEGSSLISRHLAAPAAAGALVVLIATVAAAVIGGSVATALDIGLVNAVPLGLVLACCAAFSATTDPYAHLLAPNVGYVMTAAPVAVAAIAVGVPALLARETERHGGAVISTAVVTAIGLAIVAAIATPIVSARFKPGEGALW
jgi:hypothetical protein